MAFGDLTAKEIAAMSDADLEGLIGQWGHGGIEAKYADDFLKFSESEQGQVLKTLQNRMGSLSQTGQSKVREMLGKAQQVTGASGFAGAGQAIGGLQGQMQGLFGQLGAQKSDLESQISQQYTGFAENMVKQATTTYDKQAAGLDTTDIYRDSEGVLRNVDDGSIRGYGMNLFGGGLEDNLQYGEGSWTQPAWACVVSTALNTTGAWNDKEQSDAVKWCRDTHHDGTDRGKTWVDGYHTWGKFLAKWVKKSKIVRSVVDTTTTAFIDHTRRNKPNYLGFIIHYGWVNPLSYEIGYSRKNKILGKLATIGMVGAYSVLFPLFGLVSIPHIIRKKLWQ